MKSMTEVTDSLLNDCKNALKINEDNFNKILSDNKNTDYGKQMGFERIKTGEEYRKNVPVTDFTPYDGKICNPNAFTVYPINSILISSGTTGKQKLFPLTEESLKRYSSYFQDPQYIFSHVTGKRFSVSMHHPARDGVTIFSYAYHYWLWKQGLLDCSLFAGGEDFLFCEDEADIPYVKVWIMLSCPELEAIQSVYLYETTTVFQYMEENWKTVIDDMKSGSISANLSEKYKSLLLKNRPSDDRIAEIESVFNEGFEGVPIAKRLWKGLKLICGIGGKMYSFQERMLRRYVGDLPTNYHTYSCSECVIAAPVFDMPLYVLLPQSAYYEFIPAGGCDEDAVGLKDLELGKEYEPVVTNFSGMYRYRVNDIIKVRSFLYDSPVFEVIGRRKYLLDVTGEKVDAANASSAVTKMCEENDIWLSDYAIGIDSTRAKSRYILFVEGDNLEKISGEIFDKYLREFAYDYNDIRNLEWLDVPAVYSVGRGEIASSGKTVENMAHAKPHIFLSDDQVMLLLERGKKLGAKN